MNKMALIPITALLLFVTACNQSNKNQTGQVSPAINYFSVDEVISQGDSLANKIIHVEGMIVHVCKHNGKRFKIVDEIGKHELKIELGDELTHVDVVVLGKEVKVTGKLIPVQMDEKMVLQWEIKMKENHKGEEKTDHYKEELAFIQDIYKRITSGEIPFYIMYSLAAETYLLE